MSSLHCVAFQRSSVVNYSNYKYFLLLCGARKEDIMKKFISYFDISWQCQTYFGIFYSNIFLVFICWRVFKYKMFIENGEDFGGGDVLIMAIAMHAVGDILYQTG